MVIRLDIREMFNFFFGQHQGWYAYTGVTSLIYGNGLCYQMSVYAAAPGLPLGRLEK